jgi:alpha-L-fucosidase
MWQRRVLFHRVRRMMRRSPKIAAVSDRALVEFLEQRKLLAASPLAYGGTPATIPGAVKFASYDTGGKGVSYNNVTNPTFGSRYRADSVGIGSTTDNGGNLFIAYVHPPEWVNYSVAVVQSGTYSIDFRVAVGSDAGGTIHLESDGKNVTGPIVFNNTGGWSNWTDLVVNNVSLTAGNHVIRMVADSEPLHGLSIGNFEKMTFKLTSTTPPPVTVSTPFQNQPQGVPGTIEFENYDVGGEGVAYHDTTAGNSGGVYRSDNVDIGAANDAGGGYYVGWAMPGEWLKYTVNVASTTTYTLGVRVATANDGGTFHINVDGINETGPITLPKTGGWQNWTTISVPNVAIPAGKHVLTLVMDSAVDAGQAIGNFNWMSVMDNPATSPRTQWWRDAKYGMFIHWGLYSQLAGHWNGQTTTGYGEWIENDLHIPQAQYAAVAQQFDPTQFNAAQWVQIAKSAGMQYIVLTAKHHDGFSMFNTSVNNYNVVADTPWHQDPVALLSAATHAAGLKFGAYYSILNWADPNASAAGIGTYMQTMKTQLKELITNDHPDILWFDGEWPTWWTDEMGRELTEYVRNLNPAMIINNRIGKRLTTDGDYDTPEQLIPTNEPAGRLWETAMTLNDTWGYKDTDNDWKSASTIISDLTDIVANGGNYLLNVGPTGAGVIPAPAVNVLTQVGAWLKADGSAIYGTTQAPVGNQSWGQLTRKGNTLYAIVYTWPANGVLHIPVKGAVSSTSILGGGALSFNTSTTGVDITVPTTMPTSPATVIQINFSGPMSA